MSTFSTYEITSHKREGGGRKNVGNITVLSNAIFLSLEEKYRLSHKEGEGRVKKLRDVI